MSNQWVPTSSKGSSGGSGTVTSVSSADTSIAVTNPTTTPSLKLATLDVIATNEPPAAAVPMNAQKFTGLANGTLATDSAAFGQIPTSLPPSGSAGGVLSGTYPNPGMAAGAAATNLGSAGGDLTGTYPSPTIAASAVTTAKLAAAVTLDAIATAHATAADVNMNSHKITNLTNGAGAQDAAAFGQIPTALPPNGSAGGDLTGTYPNPTVGAAKITTAKLAAAVTLDAIATANATAADVAMNSHKITGLTNGSASSDAAAFGQIPGVLPIQKFATGIMVPSFPTWSTAVGTASRAYLVRFLCLESGSITKIAFITTAAATNNDNCDVGIYNSSGSTLLVSAGSTAGKLNATAGVQTVTVSSTPLTAGTIYYAAFAYGTVGGTAATLVTDSMPSSPTPLLMGSALPNVMHSIQASAFPLAAPHTTAGTSAGNVPVLALLY